MKKIPILVLAFLSFILQRGVYDIARTIFVSTIHLAKEDDETLITFFIPSSFSVGKTEGESQSSSTILKSKGKSLKDVFNKAENSSELELNYRHIVSVVFDQSYLDYELLNNFTNFLIENKRIDFNFHIFTSTEKSEDLFSFKNPENISSYYSILNVNSKSDYLFKYIKPLHFIDFVRGLNKDEYTLKIPNLGLGEDFNLDGEKSKNIYLNGIRVLNKQKSILFDEKISKKLLYLNTFEYGRVYVEEMDLVIQSIKYKIKNKKSPIVFMKITYETMLDVSEEKLKELLIKKVKEAYQIMLDNDLDYYNLKDINLKYKKDYSLDSLTFDIKLAKE